MAMNKKILAALVLVLADVSITCAILGRGCCWNDILLHLRIKFVGSTGLDFLCLAILRSGILLGAILGLIYNPIKAPERMLWLRQCIYILDTCILLYLSTKLLIYSEYMEFLNAEKQVKWFWMNLSWSVFATGIGSIIFITLGTVHTSASSYAHNVSAPEHVAEETSTLLGNQQSDGETSINNFSHSMHVSSTVDINIKKSCGEKEQKEQKKSSETKVNKVTIMKMLSYSKKDFGIILLAVVFLLGAAMGETFIPLFTGRVITGIAIEQDYSKFINNIILMSMISVVAAVCAGCRGGLMTLATARFNIRIRNCLFKSLTKQEISFFDTTKSGDILSRLTSDTSTMSDMIGLNCNIFLRSFVKGVGTCVFMFLLSWRLSIVTFMGLPLVIGMSKLYGSYYKKLQSMVQDSFASANEVAEEVVSSMRTVRSFANECGENARYEQKMSDVYHIEKKQALAYAGYMLSTEIAELALVTGTLWYGGHLVMNGLMSSQNLISFILYQLTLGDCMSSIGSVYTGLMQALGASEKVFKLIDREPEIELSNGDMAPPEFTGCVEFDNVSFSYPSRPDQEVLKNVSFVALPGQVTALVGPSGGGKSTCVNLIQYFYQCSSGSVRIDGLPIEKYSHKYIHHKISLVGQEPILYARSVRDNISYGLAESECSSSDVVNAARKSNAHTFITALTEQYDTECGEKGVQLSGGQKQRIAIARALVRNPRILILDEATSALDTESEFLVQEALQSTMRNRTVIVIAHRLSTVENADKIVVIDKGKVLEEGTHAELMKKSGMYFKLVHRQLHGHSDKDLKNYFASENCTESHDEKIIGIKSSSELCLSRSFSSGHSIGSEKSVIYDSDDPIHCRQQAM